MKRVVGDNATLPCHHQLWQMDTKALDVEWLLQKPGLKQQTASGKRSLMFCICLSGSQVITYSGSSVYTNMNEDQKDRVSFAADYLKGDASLLIRDLLLTDSGEYSCKVKNVGQYQWSIVNLIVLVKPSKPRCWKEGNLQVGSTVKMSCKSSDGSDPIIYKWERVLDKGKTVGKLPLQAYFDKKNPEIITLSNLTQESTGTYKCTASNDVGAENCIIEITINYVRGVGVVAGAVVGVAFGVLLILFIIWLVFHKKEKKKYEEEETPNEIREDAEAPKAKLVKPNSLSSSRSGSSRSGASSTQSMVHSSAPRGHRPRPVTTLKENGQPPTFTPSPPTYTQVITKETEPDNTKLSPGNLTRMGATPVMIPAQTKAFQTV
ncbi:CLMP protein, partial [Amia calva]|nr:CLMP protein [Amia calva]